jgi:DnaJ-domain-containing protein 1
MAKRRFEAQEQTIRSNLRTTARKLAVDYLRVESDETGRSRKVSVVFDRAGTRYTLDCDRWDDWRDNFRAVQLHMEYLYRIMEGYGVTQTELAAPPSSIARKRAEDTFRQVFAGALALPDSGALALGDGRSWWSVLRLDPNAPAAEIESAYKALAKVHHPDAGGDEAEFKRLVAAYEAGKAARRKVG